MNEHITWQLHEAAEAHQPDRARMLARVQRGPVGPAVRHRARSGLRSWPKAALAGLATAGILATGAFAAAGIVRSQPPSEASTTAPAAPAPTVTPEPTPSSPPATITQAPAPAPLTTAPASAHPTPTPSASARAQNGPLWSEGSVDAHTTIWWGQNNLTLRTTQPLTSLTVELRIAQTGGIRDAGSWQTLAGGDFTVTTQESGGVLVYRWVLKPGRTVPAGEHQFAAQFNHATGAARSTANDGYRVDAQSAGGSA
ncbi:hypothetical protein, partial [Kitasatospora sp. NPDC093558]|uniref:hypothetical protein n=1 Tax=Kitasatospora sp. NPDC093558 TaxID=3155201 RepID=UPI003414B572